MKRPRMRRDDAGNAARSQYADDLLDPKPGHPDMLEALAGDHDIDHDVDNNGTTDAGTASRSVQHANTMPTAYEFD